MSKKHKVSVPQVPYIEILKHFVLNNFCLWQIYQKQTDKVFVAWCLFCWFPSLSLNKGLIGFYCFCCEQSKSEPEFGTTGDAEFPLLLKTKSENLKVKLVPGFFPEIRALQMEQKLSKTGRALFSIYLRPHGKIQLICPLSPKKNKKKNLKVVTYPLYHSLFHY